MNCKKEECQNESVAKHEKNDCDNDSANQSTMNYSLDNSQSSRQAGRHERTNAVRPLHTKYKYRKPQVKMKEERKKPLRMCWKIIFIQWQYNIVYIFLSLFICVNVCVCYPCFQAAYLDAIEMKWNKIHTMNEHTSATVVATTAILATMTLIVPFSFFYDFFHAALNIFLTLCFFSFLVCMMYHS